MAERFEEELSRAGTAGTVPFGMVAVWVDRGDASRVRTGGRPAAGEWDRWLGVAFCGGALRARAARDPFGAVDAVLQVLEDPQLVLVPAGGAPEPFSEAGGVGYGAAMDGIDCLMRAPAGCDLAFCVREDLCANGTYTGPFLRTALHGKGAGHGRVL